MALHRTVQSAADQIQRDVNEALEQTHLMVAVWSIDQTGRMTCRRTSWQFPLDRFNEVVENLRRCLFNEGLEQAPLPVAEFLRKTDPMPVVPAAAVAEVDDDDGE